MSHRPPQKKNSERAIPSEPLLKNWTPYLRAGVQPAESRLSDFIVCQNDCQALEFKDMARIFLRVMGLVPMRSYKLAFQSEYLYGMFLSFFFFWVLRKWKFNIKLEGRIECVYDPAMTKAFLHGRTEAIRSVQPQRVNFINVRFSKKLYLYIFLVWLPVCDGGHQDWWRSAALCSQNLEDPRLKVIFVFLLFAIDNADTSP